MKRLWMSTASAALAVMLWSPQVHAKGGSVDAFLLQPANRALPESAAGASQRGLRIDSVEGRMGVPTFVFSEKALRAGPTQALKPVTQASADAAAREHLRGVADMYRLSRSDVDNAVLQNVHLPKNGRGAVVATYGRRVNGIEVFRSEVKVVMNASHELVALSGYLAPRAAEDAVAAQPASFRLSAPQALARAVGDVTGTMLDARAFAPSGTQGDYSHYTVDANVLASQRFGSNPRVKKVLYPMPDGLVPAYYVEVNSGSASTPDASYFAYVISARDGSTLVKTDLTESEAFTYRVYADPVSKLPYDGPQGTEASPHPTGTPNGYQAPLDQPANLVTLASAPFSQNDPWLAPNATQTSGNNVDAYIDLGGNDGFQAGIDFRAPLSDAATRSFDYQYDLTKAPGSSQNQRQAAIVNLFYMNNWLHDWYYDAGFDEASGNAQASNYGRGGMEGDPIRAEAQDYGGRNNANMSTPADGARPRMQMYVFDGVAEFNVSQPASVAHGYVTYGASFGPASYDVDSDLAMPPTDADPNKNAALRIGCNADNSSPYTGTPFAGKIAVIERGTCSFVYKVLNAQRAGALGVVITNSATGALGGMAASGIPAVDNAITVPAVMVSKPEGDAWRTEVANTNTVKAHMRKTVDMDRDGTIDNGIIAHEWGHYISNRLIGNAAGLTNHQGRSMGEGWGDFHALLLTVRAEDAAKPANANWSGVYSLAGYTMSGGANQGYYYGIRRVPYTTDMTKNPLTLKHIASGTPLPNSPIPPSGGLTGTGNSEVHNAGEIWATMLWECYASLLNAHPFDEAQDRMKRYLVAAYKATPNQPTYLEARDAVLATVAAADAADYQRFIAAFAKRGAGFGAQVPDRNSMDHIGVVESYQTGDTLQVVSMKLDDSATGCDRDGILDAGETGYLTVTVRNVGASDLTAITATAAVNGSSSGVVASLDSGNTLTFGNLARGATATARIPVTLKAAPAPAAGQLATLGVDLTLPVNQPSGGKVASFVGNVNYDEAPNASAVDSAGTVTTTWTGPTLGNDPQWKNFNTGSLTYWHGVDANSAVDAQLTSPIFTAAAGKNFVLSFFHRYSFETSDGGTSGFYDGGVLEVSVDGGAWTDVWDLDWYSGTTANAGYVNVIDLGNPFVGGQPGYVGLSAGFPNFSKVTVNFGPQFAGHQVRVRFRTTADESQGGYGWDVTNIQVTGATNATPFTAKVAEAFDGTSGSPTCNLRPVADAGAAQTVKEFTVAGGVYTPVVVTLNGENSADPDAAAGSTLSYTWTQVGGPAVTLNNANTASPTFSASVSADTLFTFQLVVNDGVDSSLPKTVQVLVQNVNRAPKAVARVIAGGPTTVDERSGSITLDASGSTDADGEPLNFTWEQKAGPAVTLDDPTSATPTFTPPEVTADTAFTFQLTVDDGIDANAAPITITVRQVDRAPVADAGTDQTVKARSTVQLAGSAVDPDGEAIDGYAWTQSTGPTVQLTGGTTATPSFTAPDVKGNETVTLSFSLVATAHGLPSMPKTVNVTVGRSNRKPSVHGNNAITVNERTAVKVTTAAEDADGDTLTYAWTQVGGPLVTLNGTTTPELSFTSPEVSGDTVLLFRLVASDDVEASDVLEVAVTVKNVPRAPTAKTTESTIAATEGDTVNLNAATSVDPDGQPLKYHWEQVSGPTVTLVGADSAVASFVVPKADTTGASATFRVTVTDADGLTSVANVLVQLDATPKSGCSVAGNGAGSALVPVLTMLGLMLGRRRRKA